jgi:hypothetical protein
MRHFFRPIHPLPISHQYTVYHVPQCAPHWAGNLLFYFNAGTGTLALQNQHTPGIASIIFSSVETYECLAYDAYTLSCDKITHLSFVSFTKRVKPYITILGTYAAHLSHIPLMCHMITIIHLESTCISLSMGSDTLAREPLSANMSSAMHQALRLCHRHDHLVHP